jgi:hypothetical protein
MKPCVKSFFPLVVALAATSVFANQGGAAKAASDDAEHQPTQSLQSQAAQGAPTQSQSSQPSSLSPGRIVLFEYANFAGPRVTIDSGMAQNLDWTNFNNPLHHAASAKVESGEWKICSDRAMQGECRVVGPGEYATLSGGLSTGIASAEEVKKPQLG